jgi:2-iminobutanoate/2-iminopropanoate deaminase
MAKKLVNPEQLYDGTPFGMSQAVLDTESSLVFVSGQVDWDRQYQVSQNSVSGQFEAALDNLRTALVAAGASVDSLLHMRLYIRRELEEHMESLAPILAIHVQQ